MHLKAEKQLRLRSQNDAECECIVQASQVAVQQKLTYCVIFRRALIHDSAELNVSTSCRAINAWKNTQCG